MRMLLRVALLTAAFALATAAFGWWTVPVLGVVWGALVGRNGRPVRTSAVAAGVAWTMFLAWGALQAIGRNPDASSDIQTNMFIGIAFAEAIAIYALVVALILLFVV